MSGIVVRRRQSAQDHVLDPGQSCSCTAASNRMSCSRLTGAHMTALRWPVRARAKGGTGAPLFCLGVAIRGGTCCLSRP